MCDMINATGLNKWNVLMEAAQFGYAGVISAVMDVLREKLKAHEVDCICCALSQRKA